MSSYWCWQSAGTASRASERALNALGGRAPLLFTVVPWRFLPESPHHAAITERAPLRELFSPEITGETMGLWIAFFANLAAVYLVFGWLPAMLAA